MWGFGTEWHYYLHNFADIRSLACALASSVCLYPKRESFIEYLFKVCILFPKSIGFSRAMFVLLATIWSTLVHIRQTILPNKISIFFVVVIVVVVVTSAATNFSSLSIAFFCTQCETFWLGAAVTLKFMFEHVMPANIFINRDKSAKNNNIILMEAVHTAERFAPISGAT